jgi:hypothetical protein
VEFLSMNVHRATKPGYESSGRNHRRSLLAMAAAKPGRRLTPSPERLEDRVAPASDASLGAAALSPAYAFTQQAILKTPDGDGFGGAVSMTADGRTIAVGAPLEPDASGNRLGAVHVYTRSGDAWMETAELGPENTTNYGSFGCSTAISDDGSTLVVGALGTSTDSVLIHGAVFIYARDGDQWNYVQKITPTGNIYGFLFGAAVTINGDGRVIAVGAKYEGGGTVYVYEKGDDAWGLAARFQAVDTQPNDRFGEVLAMDDAGTTLVIGAPDTWANPPELGRGAAYFYTNQGAGWVQAAKVSPTAETAGLKLGNAVAISGNGSTALISGTWRDFAKSDRRDVLVYSRSEGAWSQSCSLSLSSEQKVPGFGETLALNADGTRALVTSTLATVAGREAQGGAFVFDRSPTGWTPVSWFTPDDGRDHAAFGYAASIANETVVVSAFGYSIVAPYQVGTAYVFESKNGFDVFEGPRDQKVTVGRTATFAASATAPNLTARWQTSTNGGSEWADVAGATQAVTVGGVTESWYTVTTTPNDSGSLFRVVFTDAASVASRTSFPALLTVEKASATLSLSSSLNPRRLSDPLSITVLAASSVPGLAPPDGGIIHLAIDTYRFAGPIVRGRAVFSIPTGLTANVYTVSATYDGDAYFSAVMKSMTQDVVRGWSTLTAAVPAEAKLGEPVTIEANVAYAGTISTPGGGVVSMDGGQPFRFDQTTSSAGVVKISFTRSDLALGDHYFQFVYLGDPQASSAASGVYRLTIKPPDAPIDTGLARAFWEPAAAPAGAAGSTATSDSWNQVNGLATNGGSADQTVIAGEPATFTASATTPYQSVQWQFSDDGGATWTDVAGATRPWLRVETRIEESGRRFRAVFIDEDGGSKPTPDAALTLLPRTVDLSFFNYASPSVSKEGIWYSFEVHSMFGGPETPTGAVHLFIGSDELTAPVVDGQATFILPSTITRGSYPIRVVYESSDPLFANASLTTTLLVRRTESAIFAEPIGITTLGWSTNMTIHLIPRDSTPPLSSGGVLVLQNGQPIALVPLQGSGAFLELRLPVGDYYFQLVYLGNPFIAASSSEVYHAIVKPVPPYVPKTVISSNRSTASVGQDVEPRLSPTAPVATPQPSPPFAKPWTAGPRAIVVGRATPFTARLRLRSIASLRGWRGMD